MNTSDMPIREDLGASQPNGATRPGLQPDDITTFDFAQTPSEVVSLIGYLGEGNSSAFYRLYLDESLRQWLTIPANAIAGHYSLGDKDSPTSGQTVVWVHRNQSVVRCESVPVSIYESPPRPVAAARSQAQAQTFLSPPPGAGNSDQVDTWTYEYPRH